jgi:hypothetical protein
MGKEQGSKTMTTTREPDGRDPPIATTALAILRQAIGADALRIYRLAEHVAFEVYWFEVSQHEAELKVRKMKRHGSATPTKAETAQREKDLQDAAILSKWLVHLRTIAKERPDVFSDAESWHELAVVEKALRQRASELRKGSRS